jgi:peptide/nickel transport system substrate-binding protein/oligopeptide transport system substrate-binding protein
LAGNLDFATISDGKIKDAVAQFGEAPNGYTANPGEQCIMGPQTGTYYLLMNNEVEPLKNPLVRKAISLAINREAICEVALEGTREPADNIIPPGVAGYEVGGWADARYDVEAAKAALKEAGYPDGKGIDKLKLSFNLDGGHEKIMEFIQADLKKIGVETEFDSVEWATYLKRLDNKKYTFGRLGWAADYPIAYNFLYPIFDSKSGDNKSYYVNKEVDQAMVDAEKVLDPVERAAEMKNLRKPISEDNPVAPVMFYRHNFIASERLRDFTFGPMHLADYLNVWIAQ